MTTKHSFLLKCKICEIYFDKFCDLERHIKSCHEQYQEFACENCDKKFVTKWRMKKHTRIHTNKSTRNCHFFNNCKTCPFEELGCKFLHQESKNCILDQSCLVKLCSYKHSGKVKDKIDEEEATMESLGKSVFNESKISEATVGLSFETSTPKKSFDQCEECNDTSECTDCYVRHMLGRRCCARIAFGQLEPYSLHF